MAKLSINNTVRKGFNGVLGGVKYVNGVSPLRGTVEQNEGIIIYQKKSFGAEVIDVGKDEDGPSEVQADAQSGETTSVSSGNGPDGTGPSAKASDDGSGSDGDSSGTTGVLPEGNGHTDSGLREKIVKAVQQLDHRNDSHWTSGGKPAIAAVEKIMGEGGLTRAVIDESAPHAKRNK